MHNHYPKVYATDIQYIKYKNWYVLQDDKPSLVNNLNFYITLLGMASCVQYTFKICNFNLP